MAQTRICDLGVPSEIALGLLRAKKGATAPQIAVAMGVAVPTAYQRISMWEAQGWVTCATRRQGRKLVFLNDKKVIP